MRARHGPSRNVLSEVDSAGEFLSYVRVPHFVESTHKAKRVCDGKSVNDVYGSSAGVLFALLTDPESEETMFQQRLTNLEDGVYQFDLRDVAPGTYVLVVGSDMDNDNFICDAGEACGAYPTLNDEQLIELTENANFSLDISFDQGRFLSSSVGAGSGGTVFEGYRYKNSLKTVE